MKIAVLGAGGTGALAGAYLKKGGADVVLVDPNIIHMEKIAKDGLLMDVFIAGQTVLGEETQETVGGLSAVYPFDGEPVDVVIMLPKNMYTRQAIEQAMPLFGPKTVVITFQNGLGIVDILKDYFPEERVGHGIMHLSGHLKEPGHIWAKIHPTDRTSIYMRNCVEGSYDAVFQEVADCFTKAGLKTKFGFHEDVAIWNKLMINCAINCTCAIARLKTGEFCSVEEGYEIMRGVISEVVALANAEGMNFEAEEAWIKFRDYELPALWNQYPSAALDAKFRRQTEVDWLNGAIAKKSRLYGLEAPVNETISKLIKVIQANYNRQFETE